MQNKSIHQVNTNYIDASVTNLSELTLRGCFLATLITLVFTAGNVYMGLKISFTFNSAIPAAVISMAILRVFRDSNMLENTMVQTFASAAGTLSSIIFVLPGLVMLGFWTSFPFWQTMLLCVTGGLLGVMFTIPLRRALVVKSTLPYPEGVAAAEILRVGNSKEKVADKNEAGVKDILYGTLIASFFTLFTRGFHLLSESFTYFTKIGAGIFGASLDYSLALIGAGYLMRIRVGIAMLIGLVFAWVVAVPYFSWHVPVEGSIIDTAMELWVKKVRFIGVGTIAVSAFWTMLMLLKPIWTGIQSSMQALAQVRLNGKESIIRTEKDIPITTVLWCVILLILPLLAIFAYFIYNEHLPISHSEIITLTILCVAFIIFLSFITASICGYMAGLIGSSNSPISSIGIISTIGASAMLLIAVDSSIHEHYSQLTVALAIYMTAAVVTAGAISNDNMQDLKTGHMLGATPWRQQVALVLGVVVGSLVIPFVLQILYTAYGFSGSLPRPDMNPAEALAAPQAVMMSAIASGIITHHLEWNMILIGAVIAVFFIILDATILKRKNLRISVIAMGSGIYLPMGTTAVIILGSFISLIVEWHLKRRAKKANDHTFDVAENKFQRRGTLLASGFIVGESLVGVAIAVLIAISGDQYPISLATSNWESIAQLLGIIVFLGVLGFYCYYVTKQKKNV